MCSSRVLSVDEACEARPEPRPAAAPQNPLKRLHCAVQQYAWGRNSEDSEVGRPWLAARGAPWWQLAAPARRLCRCLTTVPVPPPRAGGPAGGFLGPDCGPHQAVRRAVVRREAKHVAATGCRDRAAAAHAPRTPPYYHTAATMHVARPPACPPPTHPHSSRRMGTHPSGPSLLADNGYAGQPLLTLLRDRPELLGAALPRFGCDLPFLFKVLSVGTALSIQSHPDKELAERLHAEKPEVGAESAGGRRGDVGPVREPACAILPLASCRACLLLQLIRNPGCSVLTACRKLCVTPAHSHPTSLPAAGCSANPPAHLPPLCSTPCPQIYKDANHKPEMALAITEFEALCAFVPHAELLESLEACPELAECCGSQGVEALRAAASAPDGSPQRTAALRAAFHEVMACPAERAAAYVARMCERLKADAAAGRQLSPRELLSLRLELQVGWAGCSPGCLCDGWLGCLHRWAGCSAARPVWQLAQLSGQLCTMPHLPASTLPTPQYPGDVGVLAAWFLNYLRLQPGQAVALPANEPHAYISGEIVEVMATSGEEQACWLCVVQGCVPGMCSCVQFWPLLSPLPIHVPYLAVLPLPTLPQTM